MPWAVSVVGNPFAGALAIACSDFGALGKLFSEAIETCDKRAGEGVVASGGSALHRIRFGLIPGVLPVLASLLDISGEELQAAQGGGHGHGILV